MCDRRAVLAFAERSAFDLGTGHSEVGLGQLRCNDTTYARNAAAQRINCCISGCHVVLVTNCRYSEAAGVWPAWDPSALRGT